MSEADTRVPWDCFGGGIGPARPGPRRGAAVVDFVAAFRLRGGCTTVASEGGFDLVVRLGSNVAVRLSP